MALLQPVDQHGSLQPGSLIGNVTRSEDNLYITNPDWKDEAENVYTAEVPIERIVPFTFFDSEKHLKGLWIIADKGHLEAASASVIVSEAPTRWDPPFADRKKAGRFLVGWE